MTSELAPEVQLLLRRIEALALPPLHTLTPAEAREMRKATAQLAAGEPEPVDATEDRILEGPGGPLPIRIYTPTGGGAGGSLVYFHGGGWVLGDLNTHDALCRGLANASGFRVVAVEYRLAPEHPHPAALEDAWTATQWVAGRESGALVVGGDSAGGHLATCVAARAREAGPRIDAQLLIYPVTDLSSFATESYAVFAEGYWLTAKSMVWFREHFLPPGTDRSDPDASPLHRPDLTGMPPTVMVAAGADVLRDEGAAYAQRLREAGVAVDYRCHEGVIHGFIALPGLLPQARQALQEAGAAVRRIVSASADQGATSEYTVADVRAGFGSDRFTSGWVEVTQGLMDRFADATLDPDWMHIDPARAARDGPFDGTIAFGFWTLSMLTHFLRDCTGRDYPPGALYGFNYGFDRVRLMSPVPVGSRIRNHLTIKQIVRKDIGRFLVTNHNEVEVEGLAKPALVAEWLLMLVYPEQKRTRGLQRRS